MEEDTPVEEEGLVTQAAPSLPSGVELGPELGGTSSSVGQVRSWRSLLGHLLSETLRLGSPPFGPTSLLAWLSGLSVGPSLVGVCGCCWDCCSPPGPNELPGLLDSEWTGRPGLQGPPAVWLCMVELTVGELSVLCRGGEVSGDCIGLPTPSLMAWRAFKELLEKVVPPPPPPPALPG